MAGYLGASPVPQTILKKQSFTLTAGQTTINTTGYTDSASISVYLNGVRLINGTDYNVGGGNGSDIVLATAANASDVLDFETFTEFTLVSQTLETPIFKDNITMKNDTEEDSIGGRESTLIFKGEQSGGEISTLAEIEASHDSSADDEKGNLVFRTNDGSDGASPTEAMRIDSGGNVGINATPKATHADADVVRFGGTGYLANWEDAEVYLSENMYQDTSGAYKYLTASHATLYSQTTGKHQFRVAGSGSADAAITFNTALEIDNDGHVTMPNQPCFMIQPTSQQSNIAINSAVTVVFNNERFDVGGNFSGNTFTAPVTGKYQLNVEIRIDNVDTAATYYHLYLITSNRGYFSIMDPNFSSDLAYHSFSTSVLTDMDANDTAYVAIYQANGASQTDINQDSNFSGILVA